MERTLKSCICPKAKQNILIVTSILLPTSCPSKQFSVYMDGFIIQIISFGHSLPLPQRSPLLSPSVLLAFYSPPTQTRSPCQFSIHKPTASSAASSFSATQDDMSYSTFSVRMSGPYSVFVSIFTIFFLYRKKRCFTYI